MSRPGRSADPAVHGILVVAKPAGPTSHDVVALVRRLTGVRRVGHGGTLDPFAMGVLPIFLGSATRMVEYHLADEKAYRATLVFGAHSSTDDLDGELTPVEGPPPTRAAVEAALARFRGPIEQVPPDHSAVHVGGRRAYELARRGDKPSLEPRRVTIHALDLVSWDAAHAERPAAEIEVRCSAGTYVRALARDLGLAVSSGAYLGALTRTASGPFGIEDAHPLLAAREALAQGRTAELLLPPDAGLEAIPSVELPARDVAALARGQVIRVGGSVNRAAGTTSATPGPGSAAPAPDDLVRVIDPSGRLAAMAHLQDGRLHPDKVFISPEP
ncbi:tRNA pseudouridine(55) synthase TruB [soil metagenome]